ncbi:FAD-binding oxidoreductase [Rhodobacteraceae bacterium NNCM2]|nr:FAD-binding oxidoreductase [Coraliihabitans acroporae]
MTRSADFWNQSLWWASAKELAPDSDTPADADVVVIGGGFTGLSTALHLAENGASVTLLDAEEIGFGASGRNGGQVIPGLKLDPSAMRAKWGRERGDRLAAFAGGAADLVFDLIERHGIDCDPRRAGWIQAAHSETALAVACKRAREWEAEGVPVEILDRAAIANATGARVYAGGWRDPRAGTLNPLSFARGLARTARAVGVKVVTQAAVKSIAEQGAGWEVALADQRLSASIVVMATNAYDQVLFPRLARSLLQVQSNIVATEPLDEETVASILPSGACCSETRKLSFYYRVTSDNRVVFGGRGAVGNEHSLGLQSLLEDGMRRMLPQLRAARIEHAWSGHLALTMDGLPHLHQPKPNLWAIAGYNGRGVAMSTALGAALAAHITTGEPLPLPATGIESLAWHGLRKPVMNIGVRYYWMKDKLGLAS